jgi:undecaprenyl-diphosphatase
MENLTLFQAAILGLVQGLTEFLPVSSSGHLVIFQSLFGLTGDQNGVIAFDVMLHLGTLLAVIMVFNKDITNIVLGRDWELVKLLILATLPTIIIGVPIRGVVASTFLSLTFVGCALIFTGVILWLTQYIRTPEHKDISWRKSLLIGFSQIFALFPGVSRSGMTIATGLFLKVDRYYAARFSFLMSIPAILGAAILEVPHLTKVSSDAMFSILAGTVVAAVTGYLAIKWMLHIVQRGQIKWFGVYCIAAGILSLSL